MGIKKLNKFLTITTNSALEYKSLNEYIRSFKKPGYRQFNTRNKVLKISIDVYLYMYKYLYSFNDHIYGFLNQIIRLLSVGIIPVYVFDGKPPIEKNVVIRSRIEKKKRIKERLNKLNENIMTYEDKKLAEKLNKQIINITPLHITNLKKLIKLFNLNYIEANGEADAMCGKLYKEGLIDACLSEDMDILIYGCNKLIKLKKNKVIEYDINYILNNLNISYDKFVHMCLLFGCDYVKPIPKMKPLELYNIALNSNSLKDALEKTNNEKCIGMFEKYKKALKIYKESINNEKISNGFKIILNKNIDVNEIIKFLNKTSIKYFNTDKLISQLKYLNKMINREKFKY